jgi:ABC-type transporter Mla maintaining outer membrane lipid asymmetry ATPase subunit MlaF
MYTLSLNNVSFSYGPQPLLQAISLEVRPGEIVGITAHAGAGKSTLLKLCAGLLEPHHGILSIDRKSFWALSVQEQHEIQSHIGFFFQEGGLIANMTISKNLALPLQYRSQLSEKEIAVSVDTWLKKFRLSSYRDLRPAAGISSV